MPHLLTGTAGTHADTLWPQVLLHLYPQSFEVSEKMELFGPGLGGLALCISCEGVNSLALCTPSSPFLACFVVVCVAMYVDS